MVAWTRATEGKMVLKCLDSEHLNLQLREFPAELKMGYKKMRKIKNGLKMWYEKLQK
jgi:hypothetical protein